MTFSIIIPTRHRAQLLATTLDSLASQSCGDFEVIVVCDGEDPQTGALSETYSANYPLRWILTPENRGQASARNTGVLVARGEVLLFLDDDTVAASDLVYQHRRQHEAHSKEGILVVYGSLVYVDQPEPDSHTERLMRMERERTEAELDAYLTRPGFESIELDHRYRGCGVNCSIRRTAFLKYRGFDPALRYRAEDFELGSRLYDGGAQFVFEPRALAYHRETKQLSEQFRGIGEMTGRVDVYRALMKGQRNAQTRGLTWVQRRSPLRRLKIYWYWNHPDTLRGPAELFRRVTDATGSVLSYHLWRRLEGAAGYWQGVRSEGLTLKALRELVGKPLPVLMFRSISLPRDPAEKGHTLSPKRFERVVRTLGRLRYASVDPAEGLSPAVDGRRVVLTFDGFEDFYLEVFPHIRLFGLKPVVFLAVGRLGDWSGWDEQTGSLARKWLPVEQVRELHQQGVQFGSYGLTHAWLPGLPDEDLHREMVESKARLEDLLGSEVTCFAYPGGGVDQRVRGAVARAGYQFGFSRRAGLNFWEDRLALKCITVNEGDTAIDLLLKFVTGRSTAEHLPALLRRILRVGDTNKRLDSQNTRAP